MSKIILSRAEAIELEAQAIKLLTQENKWEDAIQLLEKASEGFRLAEDWKSYGSVVSIAIAHLLIMGEMNEAQNWLERMEGVFSTLEETEVCRMFLYKSKGAVAQKQGKIEESIKACQQGIALLDKTDSEQAVWMASLFKVIGTAYANLEDYSNAILFLQQSLHLVLPIPAAYTKPQEIAQTYGYLGRCYAMTQQYDKGIASLQKALDSLLELFPKDYSDCLVAYVSIGNCYVEKTLSTHQLDDYQEAIAQYQLALNLSTSDTPLTALANQNLGFCYMKTNALDKAILHLNRGLHLTQSFYGTTHPAIALIYLNLGSCYFNTSLIEESRQNYQMALDSLYPDYNLSEDYHLLPPMTGYSDATLVIKGLIGKGMAFYHLSCVSASETRIEDLTISAESFLAACQLLDKIRTGFDIAESKLLITQKIEQEKLFEAGIEVGLKMQEEEVELNGKTGNHWAFDFCEQSKATVLMNAMQDSWAKANTHLPDDLLQKEKSLQIRLTELDKKIQKLQLKAEKTELEGEEKLQLHRWQAHFFDAHQTYTILKKQLETSYPEYYQMKHDAQMVAVSELQSILEEHQILLNYFVGKSEIFIFVVTADDFVVMREDKPDDFEGLVTQFLQAIQHHEFDKYTQIAAQLYLLLLKSVEDYFIDFMDFEDYESVLKHLLIVPDGILCYLPFEALLRTEATPSFQPSIEESSPTSASKPSYTGLDYLLNHVAVSYHYSASLLYVLHQRKSSQNPKADLGSFAGFAPVYQAPSVPAQTAKDTISENPTAAPSLMPPPSVQNSVAWANRSEAIRSDGSFVPLPFSETEVKNIAELFAAKGLNTQTFLHEAATKEAFETVSNRYRFLLVAAHGLVNDEKTVLSGLVFYTSPLSPPEEERLGVGSERVDDGRQTVSGGQEKEEVGGKRQEVIYEKRDVGSEKREGVIYEKREGVEKSPISNSLFEGSKEDVKGDIENKTNYQSLITNHQTDCILSMEETYQLDLRGTDLVVLSSCDSGIGRLVKGEGMMALNRGFLYAGASNVISTLFKVYDQPSSLLTQYLFEAILEGESYTFALRTAKMRLLQHKEASVKSWCGFVLFGK